MSRRMSCSMTVDAVRARTKTVTRRHVDTWKTLAPGDRLTLIEKGMGLAKGEKQVVLAEVEIVDVRVEPVVAIRNEPNATSREGLAHMSAERFIGFWLEGHGYGPASRQGMPIDNIPCRRIEWSYINNPEGATS